MMILVMIDHRSVLLSSMRLVDVLSCIEHCNDNNNDNDSDNDNDNDNYNDNDNEKAYVQMTKD